MSWAAPAAPSCRPSNGSTPWGWRKSAFPACTIPSTRFCKRFKISLAEREKHGALIDARLLAAVYLELRGGRERRLDLEEAVARGVGEMIAQSAYGARPRRLARGSPGGKSGA